MIHGNRHRNFLRKYLNKLNAVPSNIEHLIKAGARYNYLLPYTLRGYKQKS